MPRPASIALAHMDAQFGPLEKASGVVHSNFVCCMRTNKRPGQARLHPDAILHVGKGTPDTHALSMR